MLSLISCSLFSEPDSQKHCLEYLVWNGVERYGDVGVQVHRRMVLICAEYNTCRVEEKINICRGEMVRGALVAVVRGAQVEVVTGA